MEKKDQNMELEIEKDMHRILHCLINDDPEAAMEILENDLKARTSGLKDCELPKTTLYNAFRDKNPTLRTFAKLMRSFSLPK